MGEMREWTSDAIVHPPPQMAQVSLTPNAHNYRCISISKEEKNENE